MSVSLEQLHGDDWTLVQRNFDTVRNHLRPPLPQVRVTHNAAQNVATATAVPVAFNTELWDNGNMHDNVTNNTRLTAKVTGLYSITIQVAFSPNATGFREIFLRVNGVTVIHDNFVAALAGGNFTELSSQTEYRLAAGDYVEAIASQNSGVTLTIPSIATYLPQFMMHRIGGYTNEGIA